MYASQCFLGGKKKCFEILWENIICVWAAKNVNMPIGYTIIPMPTTWDQSYVWQREYFTAKNGSKSYRNKAHMKLGCIGYEPDVADFVNQGVQLLGQVLCIFSLKLSKFCYFLFKI